MLCQLHRCIIIVGVNSSSTTPPVILWTNPASWISLSQMSTVMLSVLLLSFPHYTSKASITAATAPHKPNTFIPCLIGFAGMYWMKVIARPQYLIIDSSNDTSFPACQTRQIPNPTSFSRKWLWRAGRNSYPSSLAFCSCPRNGCVDAWTQMHLTAQYFEHRVC